MSAPAVSVEFLRPTDAATERTPSAAVARRAPLRPAFVSVSYGADGSTRERTHAAVMRIGRETELTSVPHLTCVGARREAIAAIARRDREAGIRHIVALRGAGERAALAVPA